MMTLCRFLRLTSAQDTSHYRAPTKLRKGNVFSRFCLSVILSGGVSHVTITMMHWTSLLAPQPTLDLGPPALTSPKTSHLKPHAPLDIRLGTPLLVTSDGHYWRPVQTCSFETQWERHLVVAIVAHTVGGSWLYASYWDAFLYWKYFYPFVSTQIL